MAKREVATVSFESFAKVFLPMVREGKSALEIGKAVGFKGTDEKITLATSAKAAQLRGKLKMLALDTAAKQGMDEKQTNALVSEMTSKIPRIKGGGRPSRVGELVSMIDGILAEIDAPPEDVVTDLEIVE
jgi:hypothetical protein